MLSNMNPHKNLSLHLFFLPLSLFLGFVRSHLSIFVFPLSENKEEDEKQEDMTKWK
jgi:hypothetical protein